MFKRGNQMYQVLEKSFFLLLGPRDDKRVWEIYFCELGSGQFSHIFPQLVTASQMAPAAC